MKVKLLTDTAIAPTRGSEKAAGYDLYADQDSFIEPNERVLVKTGIAVATPANHYGRVAGRSGLAYHKGIDILGGVIDEDYRGELGVIMYNTSSSIFMIKKGDKIAQLILEKLSTPAIEVVEDLDSTARGADGYGSTGQ